MDGGGGLVRLPYYQLTSSSQLNNKKNKCITFLVSEKFFFENIFPKCRGYEKN